MNLNTENCITVYEAAELLRVSRATLYRFIQEGIPGMGFPPYYRIGKRILFDRQELLKWFRCGGHQGLEQSKPEGQLEIDV